MEIDLDARGRLCPQPIIDLAKRIEELPVGSIIRLVSDDAAIVYDLPAWCRAMGHELLGMERAGREVCGRVRKSHV